MIPFDKLHPAEIDLARIIMPDRPETIAAIEPYDPRTYIIRNERGVDREYFALSQTRALALAYFDQGWQKKLTIVG